MAAKKRPIKTQVEDALCRIAFASDSEPEPQEVKVSESLKAIEMLCKLKGYYEGEKKTSEQGMLEQLLKGLRGEENDV
ncbi:MAG: hypothetical protein RR022_03375 [Angelakisella sp.]